MTFVLGWVAALTITIMPLWQGRHSMMRFWKYAIGGRGKALEAAARQASLSGEMNEGNVEEVNEKQEAKIQRYLR